MFHLSLDRPQSIQLPFSKGLEYKQVKKLEPQVIQAAAALGLDIRKYIDNSIFFDIKLLISLEN